MLVFFFTPKTAYEMRISDWSSDVCSSDLARLETELDVIARMGFPGYFLIVADFINWAKDHGIPVGPGRGSGAGSLVAWALGITDLDQIGRASCRERVCQYV